MTDTRWEDDTLFLLFEEDFRFTNVRARDDVSSGRPLLRRRAKAAAGFLVQKPTALRRERKIAAE